MQGKVICGLLAIVALAAATGQSAAKALPPGTALLGSAFSASRAKGSYHLQGSIIVGTAGLALDRVTIQGDISTKAKKASVIASTRTPAGPLQVEERILGKHLAVRTGSGKWTCSSLGSIQQFAQSLTGFARPPSAQTVGAGTLNGRQVWRVRALESIRILGATQRIPLVFLIAEAGHTLLQETATTSVRITSASVRETLLFKFSRYGEAVRVRLPMTCRD